MLPCSHTVCQIHSLPHSPWQCLHSSFSLLRPPVHPPLNALAVTDLAFYFTEKTEITKKLLQASPHLPTCTHLYHIHDHIHGLCFDTVEELPLSVAEGIHSLSSHYSRTLLSHSAPFLRHHWIHLNLPQSYISTTKLKEKIPEIAPSLCPISPAMTPHFSVLLYRKIFWGKLF